MARWFLILFGDFAALGIWAKAPLEDADFVAVIHAQQFAFWRNGRGLGLGVWRAKWTRIATFRIAGTPDKRATGTGRAHGQFAKPTIGADTRISSVFIRREQMRFENLVDLFQHLSDPQIRCFSHGCREIIPEPGKHILIVAIARADIVQFFFKAGGKINPT